MTPQTAKAWHGLWVALVIGVGTAVETAMLTKGLPVTTGAWLALLNACGTAAVVAGVGWYVRRQPTTPTNGSPPAG